LLRGWKTTPPLTEAAGEEDRAAVKYAHKAKRRAERLLRNADGDIEELHRARKAFKRSRYAAELVEPVDSKMKAVAQQGEEMQTVLGEHQDAIVAAHFLATMSADGEIDSGSAFTLGVLMANELNRAAKIRASVS
jgi:CHAD domain-containing protein